MQQKGQILVEALVAITIAVVGLLGIFALLSNSLSLNKVVGDQYVGAYLASEGIEIVKNLIDTNVLQGGRGDFNNGDCLTQGDHLMDYYGETCAYENKFIKFDAVTGLYSYKNGEDTRYKRRIVIGWPDSNQIKINSIVTWTTRGGAEFDIELEDHFYNWK